MQRIKKRIIAVIILVFFIGFNQGSFAGSLIYPDYAYEFLGKDKFETFNRKMFNFNLRLNKYCIKPIHMVWAAIMPQYGMDRLYGISYNIEFPIRFVSSLVQRDFRHAGVEVSRFFINTTIGLAGMYDPAKHILKVGKSTDNMDKALARCNIKSGPFFVAPVINFTTIRGLFGRALDVALNPTTYIGSPILAAIKAALTINKTSYIQSIIKAVEVNFIDPYYITKMAFGIDGYIKKNNIDRMEVVSALLLSDEQIEKAKAPKDAKYEVSAKIVQYAAKQPLPENQKQNNKKTATTKSKNQYEKITIQPDIYLKDYAPQTPLVDSMRTMLFELPEARKSIWNELSIWNRSFVKRLKTDSITVYQGRKDYKFKYLMQKNKNAPLAIIYPSTGDGINSNHPMMFAKLFYDAGYSVIIEGNPFQWEFLQSMEEDYRPGIPPIDARMMRITSSKIIDKLEKKYNRKFDHKVVFGTSLAGLDVLHMAQQESKDNMLGNAKFISICPPVNLIYSVNVIDGYMQEWVYYSDEIKQKVAYAAAKLVKLYDAKKDINFSVNHLPFDDDEAKIFTSFVMHEKLSNVIFALEKVPVNKKSDIYKMINEMGYFDYFVKYIVTENKASEKDIKQGYGVSTISDYLKTANNYKIYHTVNDYLINDVQLKQLRSISGDKLAILDNGSHMGFMYRPEFIVDFRETLYNFR